VPWELITARMLPLVIPTERRMANSRLRRRAQLKEPNRGRQSQLARGTQPERRAACARFAG
jgi:hypothetical protein